MVGTLRSIRLMPLGLCLAAIAYLALKPSPDARTIPLLPLGWGVWLDRHDTFNNISAFAVLAAVVHWSFSGWRQETVLTLLWRMLWMETLVVGLECAQLWLPRRTCDWHDMRSGLIGIVIVTIPWAKWKKSERIAGML